MKELTLIQKIDEVLYNIKVGSAFGVTVTVDKIYEILGGKYPEQIDKIELQRILKQLESDKYIEIKDVDGNRFLYITISGSRFTNHGGYGVEINEKEKFKRLSIITNRLTWIIALGTLASSLYYLNELCKSYHWFCFCH